MLTVDNIVIYGEHAVRLRRDYGGNGKGGRRLSPETSLLAESGLISGHLAAG
jgi:hypothetical protein